ncbi:LacI family DNA-binding transcriptional regulator [Paenibacillus sp. JCM 10914]|uniref:LacI family DNA-binding transcriptional regulator n=1 Tax=Paenibacillus sp. JCM 10914 TaxID=1236974 RepID=UPI0003CC5243|nr:LacI family DNA-binding transcriptional regulator [Paenibacillus sp. JCM 10914]GAE05574.1 predicted transcriptional regulator of the myo-inositol catabolic operon [Paenibacillus sp. JCM 10914]
MKSTTIYDVAKEAGVSIATVSNAINGKGKVSKKRKDEIFKVMERLKYQPSVIASALMGKKTYTIGLLIPDVSNPFFAEIARTVEDLAHSEGYSVIVCSTDNRDERVEKYIRLLEQKNVDGILIGTGMENSEILAQLAEKDLAIVMIAREASSIAVHSVVTNDFRGGTLAAEHLLGHGHTRMAVLAEDMRVTSSLERVRGFRFGLFEAGITLGEEHIETCGSGIKDGKRATVELLRSKDRPTAIFCCNDLLAIGALQAAKEAGVRVPEDLSVVGFDDTILSTVTNPSLTTISQPMDQMAQLAFNLLMNPPESSEIKQRIIMQPELVIRESTGTLQ